VSETLYAVMWTLVVVPRPRRAFTAGRHDFDPAPVDTYTLTLTVVEHLTGNVLSTASVAV